MPHVALVPFTGFRVREEEMLALGLALPGLRRRAAAVAQLPALGLLTLAGLNPSHWTCSYHEAVRADEALAEAVMQHRPALVALSALTASVEEAYHYAKNRLAKDAPDRTPIMSDGISGDVKLKI